MLSVGTLPVAVERRPCPGSATSSSGVVNAMTVDVEDYFQVSAFESRVSRPHWDRFESRVCGNTECLLQLFNDANVTATFFVLGWVADRFPALVRRIAAEGHEVASHGFEHRLVYDLTPAEFAADLRRAKGILEDATGRAVVGYRAPSYSVTARSLWAFDVLIAEGYSYDASVFPIHHDRYGIPQSPRHPYRVHRKAGSLWELPGSTVRIGGQNLPIGGGGYFRLLPYGWTRRGIAHVNQHEGKPVMFYLHPWEIDPDQPRLGGSLMSRFRHYRNLDKTEARLRRLLTEFRFGTAMSMLSGETHTVPSLEARPTLALV
ncbi:MAG: XrtA system polysaccharide deacetylase [Gammaproteobacteria bacterium]